MNLDGCDMEKIGTFDSSERTITLAGERWRPQAAKEKGDTSKINPTFFMQHVEETY